MSIYIFKTIKMNYINLLIFISKNMMVLMGQPSTENQPLLKNLKHQKKAITIG